ncbi:hypothetical protein SODALDRAFT_218793 [Sodiomyces alkalinus F11]|uniref:Uncharacterized protein n=1 Tax=Sodiomyces alkalinus (strain CBS 110278 / VKM F-3762 / F11) TaxID=1314773 RepID=A0A3N2PPN5_SODAK|nr:hypothetical protein SODALDRAFT_218793 [Sodiomyces alkalinus F11]ROT36400.1 hypothetical protein SODALDRAFT_218793 [Sodiomyces alkalinus F11]
MTTYSALSPSRAARGQRTHWPTAQGPWTLHREPLPRTGRRSNMLGRPRIVEPHTTTPPYRLCDSHDTAAPCLKSCCFLPMFFCFSLFFSSLSQVCQLDHEFSLIFRFFSSSFHFFLFFDSLLTRSFHLSTTIG